MSDLTDFLLARIADDETGARGAMNPASWLEDPDDTGHWSVVGYGLPDEQCVIEGHRMTIYEEGGHAPEHARHIARHDPARVLAECEAKRRILEIHSARHIMPEDIWSCAECGSCGERDVAHPCPTLHVLASVYADHPDYREEWRP